MMGRTSLLASARALAPRTTPRSVNMMQRRNAGGQPSYNEPTGTFNSLTQDTCLAKRYAAAMRQGANTQPPPPGTKRVKEAWEPIWYYGLYGGMAAFAVLLYFKPDRRYVATLTQRSDMGDARSGEAPGRIRCRLALQAVGELELPERCVEIDSSLLYISSACQVTCSCDTEGTRRCTYARTAASVGASVANSDFDGACSVIWARISGPLLTATKSRHVHAA